MILVLRLCQPQQQSLHGLHVLDDGAAHGGILSEGGHGQDGVESAVVGGAQTANYVEQFPRMSRQLLVYTSLARINFLY